jgi:hypothetical protein
MRSAFLFAILLLSTVWSFGSDRCQDPVFGSDIAIGHNKEWRIRHLAGRVDDGDKKILSDACVRLFTKNGKHFVAGVQVDSSGGYKFDSIKPGHYELVVTCKDFCATSFGVHLGPRGAPKTIAIHMAPDGLDSCSISELK